MDVPNPDTPTQFKLLHLFTLPGRTLTFKNGTIIADNESTLAFKYSAASNGKPKVGTFQKTKLVGWACQVAE
jgi:hypothetical protein